MRKVSNLITFGAAVPLALFAAAYLAAATTSALKPGAIAKQQQRELEQATAVKVAALELQHQERVAAEQLNHRVAHCPVNLIGSIPEKSDPRYGEWVTKQAMVAAEDLATQAGFNPGQWYLYTHKGNPLLAVKGKTTALEVATVENHPGMNSHTVCTLNRLDEPSPEIEKRNGILTQS